MQPLLDVQVIEFCAVASGPFCGMLLADLGADVVKVEAPGVGDSMRTWPPLTDGFSENFSSLNRNKRSVTLDLKSSHGHRAARDLAREADVVVENFRPGVMERLGLSYGALSGENPDLVMCSISAFGQSGPRALEGGFDLTIQAMSGIMSVTGTDDDRPAKSGVPVSDFAAGLYAAFAIVAALREVARTGRGTHIDVSMLGVSLAVSALQISEYFGSGHDPVRLGSAHPRNAPYQAFKAADGHFAMAAGNDRLWLMVCDALGRADLAGDQRFATTALRAANQDDLREMLEQQFQTTTVESLLALFRDVGVPCAPLNRYSEALNDPQVEHMGWVQDLELPNGRHTRTFGSPISFDGAVPPIRHGPPELGEHTAEVLHSLLVADRNATS